MSEQGPRARNASASWRAAAFWDEVEQEVEAFDWLDLAEFIAEPALPTPVRPGFEKELGAELLDLVKRRYST